MLDAIPAWSVIRYGDRAVLVQFESRIAPDVNRFVVDLFHALKSSRDPEIEFMVPAYCSLTIGLRRSDFNLDAWQVLIAKLLEQCRVGQGDRLDDKTPRLVEIPVCYEPPYSFDLDQVVAYSGISQDAVIQRHHSVRYRVYMLGFLPGFAYLGKIDPAIACPRKLQPRSCVPAGSVGIADSQTGVYPCDAPGGWQIIGRTPVAMNVCEPNSLRPGDEVQFRRIDSLTFESLLLARGSGERK